MKRDKIYISGPVSSIGLDEARRRFGKAEADLQKQGFRTCSPVRMSLCVWLAKRGWYRTCLWLELTWMSATCTCIFLLDGWHTSDGARAERSVARCMGLTAMYQSKLKPRGEVPAPTHVLTPEKKTSKKHKKD